MTHIAFFIFRQRNLKIVVSINIDLKKFIGIGQIKVLSIAAKFASQQPFIYDVGFLPLRIAQRVL